MRGRRAAGRLAVWAWLVAVAPAGAQDAAPSQPPPAGVHEHVEVSGTTLTPVTDVTGTAWLPPATPMYGVHRPWRGWDLRADGAALVQGIVEPGERHRTGGEATRQLTSVNWLMGMARRAAGRGRVGVRAMFSAEPWTVGDCGSISLLATGEVCQGDTIHDRSDPHDLVMELAVDYDRPLAGRWRAQVYAGLAGEPAFGPVAAPYRPSASMVPTAPIAHHWLESAHVAYGVVTVGVRTSRVKIEASAFNGRAPDERRADVDLGTLESASVRVSYLPTATMALQLSAARLQEVRAVFERQPDPMTTRTTASLTHVRPIGAAGLWASTVAVGLAAAREQVAGLPFDAFTGAALAESAYTAAGRHTLFGRAEWAAMPGHHLHAHEYARQVLPVGKVQAGYLRHARARAGLVPGLGGSLSLSLFPVELAPRYGGRARIGATVFVSMRPARHAM